MKKSHATTLRCALALMLQCGTAIQAQAFTITPTESRYESGGVRYYFAVNGWTSNDNSPSPCSSDDIALTDCSVLLAANQGTGNIVIVGSFTRWMVPVRRRSSMGQLLQDLQGKGLQIPHYGSVLVPNESANNDLCINFSSAKTGPNIGAAFTRFGPCARVIAPPLQCEIKGNTTIDHGSLLDNALDGAKASTLLDLQCRGPASVTVSASRTNSSGVRLRSDGSLYSKITVNGKDATDGIKVSIEDGWATMLNITSTLNSRGTVTPGQFSGSTVITVSPP